MAYYDRHYETIYYLDLMASVLSALKQKNLDNEYYVEVQAKQCPIHPTEIIFLREQQEPKFSRKQQELINITKL